jgi:hypothetical protein
MLVSYVAYYQHLDMVCPHQLPININGVINPNILYETPSFKVMVMVEKKLSFIFDIYAKNLNFLAHVFLAPYRAMAIPKIFTTFQANQWLHDKALNCDSKNVQ